MSRTRGRFITFEGVDGAGKSTLLEALVEPLRAHLGAARGMPGLVRTREPGGTPLGESLRESVLSRPMDPVTETLLMFAARREHVVQVIAPALARGDWVVCDRFTDASHAYQAGARGVDPGRILALESWVQEGLQPDLTVLLDVEPGIAASRRAQARAADRFEAESARFFLAVRSAYLARVEGDPARFLVVDGTGATAESLALVLARIAPWFACA
jgi:dTMP kinase